MSGSYPHAAELVAIEPHGSEARIFNTYII